MASLLTIHTDACLRGGVCRVAWVGEVGRRVVFRGAESAEAQCSTEGEFAGVAHGAVAAAVWCSANLGACGAILFVSDSQSVVSVLAGRSRLNDRFVAIVGAVHAALSGLPPARFEWVPRRLCEASR